MCVYTCIYVYSPALSTGNSPTSITMSTSSAQILTSKYYSPLKSMEAPWRTG